MSINSPAYDSELLDALDSLERIEFEGSLWRIVHGDRDPLLGFKSKARWDTGLFDVLYTSLEPSGALEEVFYHLTRQPVFPSKANHKLCEIRTKLHASLYLADLEKLQKLGVNIERFKEPVYNSTQNIGGAAYFLGFDGLIVPSARWACNNAVLFTDRIEHEDLEEIGSKDVDWKSWKAERKNSKT